MRSEGIMPPWKADVCLMVKVQSGQSRSGRAGTESCGRRGNMGFEV